VGKGVGNRGKKSAASTISDKLLKMQQSAAFKQKRRHAQKQQEMSDRLKKLCIENKSFLSKEERIPIISSTTMRFVKVPGNAHELTKMGFEQKKCQLYRSYDMIKIFLKKVFPPAMGKLCSRQVAHFGWPKRTRVYFALECHVCIGGEGSEHLCSNPRRHFSQAGAANIKIYSNKVDVNPSLNETHSQVIDGLVNDFNQELQRFFVGVAMSASDPKKSYITWKLYDIVAVDMHLPVKG